MVIPWERLRSNEVAMMPTVAVDRCETPAAGSESFCDWSSLFTPRQAEVLAMLNEAFDRAFGGDEAQAACDAA